MFTLPDNAPRVRQLLCMALDLVLLHRGLPALRLPFTDAGLGAVTRALTDGDTPPILVLSGEDGLGKRTLIAAADNLVRGYACDHILTDYGQRNPDGTDIDRITTIEECALGDWAVYKRLTDEHKPALLAVTRVGTLGTRGAFSNLARLLRLRGTERLRTFVTTAMDAETFAAYLTDKDDETCDVSAFCDFLPMWVDTETRARHAAEHAAKLDRLTAELKPKPKEEPKK